MLNGEQTENSTSPPPEPPEAASTLCQAVGFKQVTKYGIFL